MSESQEQLEAAKTETQKQSKELALVRKGPWEMPWWVLWGQHPSCGLREGGGHRGNLVLLGTTQLGPMLGTQEEIFICLPFLL